MGNQLKICGIAALLLANATGAVAQSPGAPDPAGIAVPDLAAAANKLGDERKFFVFHKPGVSFAQAYSDLSFCARYIPHGAMRSVNSFVPWTSEDPLRPQVVTSQHGLVGAVILGVVSGPLERSNRQTKMIRCMVPRGYARYRTSEALWKSINGEDMARAMAVQARIASGPVPPTPRTLP